MKKLRIAFLVFLFLVIGSYFIYKEGALPVDKKSTGTIIFVIQKGESLNSIIKRLSTEGLIRNRFVFYLIARKMGIEKRVQAGDFRLSKHMNAEELATELTHGALDEWVTVVEGLRKEEVVQQLSQQFSLSELDFIEQAKEGKLFPDTYLIPRTATAENIIQIMEDNFRKKLDEARSQYPYVKRTDRDVLTLASLVEREAKFPEDRVLVASIILHRLQSNWPLQIDATIQYALGHQRKEKTWWKRDLTLDDLRVDSTYNTYERIGLPPAPICNPGLDSLKAAFAANENTPYLFYVSDNKGRIHPAKSLEEHNANIEKYIN